jgi:hypothetical protein
MTSERFAFVKTSGIRALTEGGGEFQSPLDFIRQVNLHPVKKPAPLRVAGIQFLVRQPARLRTTPCFGGEAA